MAIEMVRIPSETPNISNIDDFVGLRYAYGNQSGYVIDKGDECSYTINGSVFKINSGRLVLQGIECDINTNGVSLSIDNVSTKRYYSVFLQINLTSNETKILATYDTATYPTIDIGDDLTKNTIGTSRLELYRFDVENGVISNVQQIVERIEYTGTALVGYDISKGTVEQRLDKLGFKEGAVTFSDDLQTRISSGEVIVTQNELKRQGNYVILMLKFYNTSQRALTGSITVPNNFIPKKYIIGIDAGDSICIFAITKSSSETKQYSIRPYSSEYHEAQLNIIPSNGYNTVSNEELYIQLGYEANPLT